MLSTKVWIESFPLNVFIWLIAYEIGLSGTGLYSYSACISLVSIKLICFMVICCSDNCCVHESLKKVLISPA